ncbi:hypothetical protein BGX34_000073 [Mortierella sp. NVP85]|nr:hypothetical protein BGX34_000073 [Mortierella sp. NVP85]
MTQEHLYWNRNTKKGSVAPWTLVVGREELLGSGNNMEDDIETLRSLVIFRQPQWEPAQTLFTPLPFSAVPGSTNRVMNWGAHLLDCIKPNFKDVFEPPKHPKPPYNQAAITEKELREGLLFTQCYWGLILANPGLRRLHLTDHGALQWVVRSTDFFFKVLSTLKGIQDLCACEHLNLPQLWRLNEVAPSMETVTTANTLALFGHQGLVEATTYENPWQKRKNPTIKTLKVTGSIWDDLAGTMAQFHNPTAQDVLAILSMLPNLENLTLVGVHNDSNNDSNSSNNNTAPASASVSSHEPLSETFAFRGHESSLKKLFIAQKNSNLTTLLPYLTSLRELRVNGLTNGSVEALATHCKNLEVLEWIHNPTHVPDFGNRPPIRDPIRSLFVSCPNLKVFDGIERFINADDIIQDPWVCQKIEKFRCRIVGIVRLTKDEQTILNGILASHPKFQYDEAVSSVLSALSNEEREVAQKHMRSREQQRLVYERLASLHHLKHLDLGFEIRDPDPADFVLFDLYYSDVDGQVYRNYGPSRTPDTLELTLASGLGQLRSLKHLEMFGFEAVDHRIEKRELGWMANNWPALKLMYGLAKDRFDMVEPDTTKDKLREYMQELRPDVIHGSLFTPKVAQDQPRFFTPLF